MSSLSPLFTSGAVLLILVLSLSKPHTFFISFIARIAGIVQLLWILSKALRQMTSNRGKKKKKAKGKSLLREKEPEVFHTWLPIFGNSKTPILDILTCIILIEMWIEHPWCS